MSEIEIPWQQLSEEALRGVAEEFITREGTDYGLRETTLEEKVAQLMAQLVRVDAVIMFDNERASCHIVLQQNFTNRPDDGRN